MFSFDEKSSIQALDRTVDATPPARVTRFRRHFNALQLRSSQGPGGAGSDRERIGIYNPTWIERQKSYPINNRHMLALEDIVPNKHSLRLLNNTRRNEQQSP